jgi:DMSO/TMAO reductase YedYZ molybdopterin-dependent catalytic subunit
MRESGRQTLGALLLAGAALLPAWASSRGQGLAPAQPAGNALLVGNEEGTLVPLRPRDWAKLPRRRAEVKGRDGKAVTYEGVPLAEVLRFAGVPFGKHPRGERVAEYVLVEAADGYRALLALAEVDPFLTDRVVLVADRLGGKPLPPRAGPYRLVVPGDKLPARWVRQVTRITVGRAPRVRDVTAPKK